MAIVLNSLQLTNFKCFEAHTVYFDNSTIMIGQNNAGKTTVVEALRILGLATARLRNATVYSTRPEWLSHLLPLSAKGIHISAKAIDTDLERVFYRYGNPPAVIKADFSNAASVRVYINSDTELFTTFFYKNDNITSKSKANSIGVPDVRVLPQIVPLTKDEPYVSVETLQRNKFSKRTSGNFRNNLFLLNSTEEYEKLQDMISNTWGRLQIHHLVKDENNCVYLNMRDGDFVTEIYYMGHGIQLWLQTLWFIVSSPRDSIVVLDEPDVYMHADLQRKLVRILKGSYTQMIIATHSVEIISEVRPENILIIDRSKNESILADGYPVLQTAISGMGSIHNINLSRLLNNKRYLYVEGYDIDILKIFYDKLFSNDFEPLDHFPCNATGGWGGWSAQKANAIQLLNEMPDLKIYFLFDSDYHTTEEKENRYKEAANNNIRLHIWERKEIENYLLVNTAISRFICKKRKDLDYSVLCEEIRDSIFSVCDSFKEEIIDKIGDNLVDRNRKKEASPYFREAQRIVNSAWENPEDMIKLVPGKKVFQKLSNHCKTVYNVSFSEQQIASAMSKSEISKEVTGVLQQIRDAK